MLESLNAQWPLCEQELARWSQGRRQSKLRMETDEHYDHNARLWNALLWVGACAAFRGFEVRKTALFVAHLVT